MRGGSNTHTIVNCWRQATARWWYRAVVVVVCVVIRTSIGSGMKRCVASAIGAVDVGAFGSKKLHTIRKADVACYMQCRPALLISYFIVGVVAGAAAAVVVVMVLVVLVVGMCSCMWCGGGNVCSCMWWCTWW